MRKVQRYMNGLRVNSRMHGLPAGAQMAGFQYHLESLGQEKTVSVWRESGDLLCLFFLFRLSVDWKAQRY